MFVDKNKKIIFTITTGLIFVVILLYLRKPNDIELISTIENDVDEEVVLNEGQINEITVNEVTDIVEDDEKEPEITDADTKENEENDKEDEVDINKEDVIGNDLPIEHSPENSGNFVIINSIGYEKFQFSEYNANVYIESVNSYAENLTADKKIYNLLAPTSSEFNIPDEYRDLSGSQKDGISYAYSNMDSEIITVDAYYNFEANKDEYLYFKTDHHWTALGAYRAYESFMKAKSEEAIPLEKYNKIDSKYKYLGSIYNMTKNERLENNLDDIWYYEPYLSVDYLAVNRNGSSWGSRQVIFPTYFEKVNKYAAFMGGDTAFSHIKVNSGKDKKIIVIKDSYGNSFIPFLLPHYKDIYVADPRYFTDNIYDVIEENQIDEVLIINYATVLQLPGFSQMLGDMGTISVTSPTAIKGIQ